MVFTTIVVTPLQMLMADDYLVTQANQIYDLTNELRESQNLRPLDLEIKLENSSNLKVKDILETQDFSHQGLKNYLHASEYDYKLAGENLARGFYSAETALKAWKDSSTHYANLTNPNYHDMGLSIKEGIYQGEPTIFIAHHFGTANEPNLAQNLTAAALIDNKSEAINKYQTFKSESNSNDFVQAIYFILIGIFGFALLAHMLLEFQKHHIHVYKDTGLFVLLIIALVLV